jgi:GT2 family glycosyltransferase
MSVGEITSETISVVIPTYNGIRYIADCLDSLRKQVRKPDEVIVVDDGSTDDTSSQVEENYPEVRCIRLDSNRGFAAAVNEGIRHSSGTYVALLNNDTRADEAWLHELEHTLQEQPSLGSCSSRMLFADRPEIINSIGIGFTAAGMAADVGYGQEDGEKFRRSRPVFGACAGAAIYRRAMLDDIGLFDEDFFMWYEDVDLSFRAQLAGYSCVYVPTAIIYHVGGGTASAANRLHLRYCSRNQVLVMVKNLPDQLRLRYFRRMAITCAKHSLKMALQRKPAVIGGYLAAIKDLRKFIKKHRITSNVTRVSSDIIERLLLLDSAVIGENRHA